MDEQDALRLAEAVRAACVAAAQQAYEEGGVRGLCAAGRWELALDAMQALELRPLVPAGAVTPRRAGGRER